MKTGVAMLDFGGPQADEELVPFLTNLLEDVLPGPKMVKSFVAPMLARSRSKIVGPNYEQIGWSPLVPTHERQVAAVREALGEGGPPMASGMMFTPPTMGPMPSSVARPGRGADHRPSHVSSLQSGDDGGRLQLLL